MVVLGDSFKKIQLRARLLLYDFAPAGKTPTSKKIIDFMRAEKLRTGRREFVHRPCARFVIVVC